MKPNPVFLIAVASCLASPSSRATGQTPKDAYDVAMTCAGITTAELAQPQASTEATTNAQSLATYYEQRAQKTGTAAGLAPSKITNDIDGFRRSIVQRLQSPDPAIVTSEKQGHAKMLQECAALPVFELADRIKGK